MKKNIIWNNEYFCGNKISQYGLDKGYIDYATLGKSFNRVLNNNIMTKTNIDDWELINGVEYDEEQDTYVDIFQHYIISDAGAEILQEYTDEILYYNDILDMYVWGVTHFGTSWDYVLTDIKLKLNK